jgi:hypothetical protein
MKYLLSIILIFLFKTAFFSQVNNGSDIQINRQLGYNSQPETESMKWISGNLSGTTQSENAKPTITIVKNGTDYDIVLENNWIRVRYGLIPESETRDKYKESAMIELLDKTTGYDAAAYASKDYFRNLDCGCGTYDITSATITEQNNDSATVRLYFANGRRTGKPGSLPEEQEVTIYRNCKVLKMHYIKRWHVFEWCAERYNPQARLAIWGDDEWYKLKGWDEAHKYNWHDSDVDDGVYYWSTRDGYDVPLNYHNHIIGGVYQQEGRGFVRVYDITMLDHYIIMPPAAGFETWDNGNMREFTSYLAPISGGRSEIFSLGKACADRKFRLR